MRSASLARNDTADTDFTHSQASQVLKWPAHLVIVRHAQSEQNVWKEIATKKGALAYGGELRDVDVSITENGKQQAIITGNRIKERFHFDQVYVSPFTRTMQTARLIIGQFRYTPNLVEDERLREIDFGVLDGLTKRGIAHFQPAEHERRARIGKYHHRPSGGENYPDVALRLRSFLGKLTRKAVGRSVLVVCHSVVVLVFRKLLERLSEQQVVTIDADKTQEIRNCSVTHYACDSDAGAEGKLILRDFNRIYY